ncbi:MAG: ATP-binding protein [Chloroflexi bacterium]|nr:ATP-binding protein [Chloroflexota bacterium]
MTQNGSTGGMQPAWSGVVISGSLTDGVTARLDAGSSVEDIKVGTLAAIEGERMRFLGEITDVSLESADRNLGAAPPDTSDPFIAQVVSGTTAYGTIKVAPRLVLDKEAALSDEQAHMPAKTVPSHFSRISQATAQDIEMVYGSEDDQHFWIGNPLDMETKLCLDVRRLVERSNGVFGKSGTGKTFLTRLLLAGILQSGEAVNLVFDMHGEYGWRGSAEGSTREVKGLKQLFGSKVAVFALDAESVKRKRLNPDYMVKIGYEEIEPEDIQILRGALNLSEVAADIPYSLQRKFSKRTWLKEFLALQPEAIADLATEMNVNQGAMATLHRRLGRLDRFSFMDPTGAHDSVGRLLDYLNRGMHVVLEFGGYGNDLLAYVLVANLLTRRIHQRYVDMKERALSEMSPEPRPLVITIEEAHRFLMPGIAEQTIFATIAREMRKYNVTLLVVDQRPSSIADEIMSQVGTKLVCLLDDENDVKAVLTGVSGGSKLRTVLASLDSKQQALAFGHAVPMPVVFRTRDYGTTESYKSFGYLDEAERKVKMEKDLADLYGPEDE